MAKMDVERGCVSAKTAGQWMREVKLPRQLRVLSA